MSRNTPGNGAKQAAQILSTPDALRDFMKRATFKKAVEDSRASNVDGDRLSRIAVSCLLKEPKLQECSLESLGQAVLDAARIGLEPGISVLGHCWLVPFDVKTHEHCDHRKDRFACAVVGTEAQLIVGYKGKEELFRRSGYGKRLSAREVRKNDVYEPEGGTADRLVHRWKMDGRGPVIGYYAVAFFTDGSTAFEDMTRAQVEEVRQNYSRAADSPAWVKSFDEMAKAKVCHRLDKHLPMSVELMAAHDLDDEEQHIVQPSRVELVSEEPVDPRPAPPAPPAAKPRSPALVRAQQTGGVQIPQREQSPLASGQVPLASEESPSRSPTAPTTSEQRRAPQGANTSDATDSNRPGPDGDSAGAPPGTPDVPPAAPAIATCTFVPLCVRKEGHEKGRCSSKEKDRGT